MPMNDPMIVPALIQPFQLQTIRNSLYHRNYPDNWFSTDESKISILERKPLESESWTQRPEDNLSKVDFVSPGKSKFILR
jgi:hypothetical protein